MDWFLSQCIATCTKQTTALPMNPNLNISHTDSLLGQGITKLQNFFSRINKDMYNYMYPFIFSLYIYGVNNYTAINK